MSEPAPYVPSVQGAAVLPPSPAAAPTRGATLVIKGDVTAAEDLVLAGRVEGTVSLPDHVLTIGPESELAATVDARVVILQGTISGDINAFERMEMKSSGRMAGDLITPRVQMSDGATFTGRLETRKPSKTAGKSLTGAERVA